MPNGEQLLKWLRGRACSHYAAALCGACFPARPGAASAVWPSHISERQRRMARKQAPSFGFRRAVTGNMDTHVTFAYAASFSGAIVVPEWCMRGSSSVGRAFACHAKGRGFESRLPLQCGGHGFESRLPLHIIAERLHAGVAQLVERPSDIQYVMYAVHAPKPTGLGPRRCFSLPPAISPARISTTGKR